MYTNRPGGNFGTPTPIPTAPTPTPTAPIAIPTTPTPNSYGLSTAPIPNDYNTRFRDNTDLTVPSYPDSNASSFSWEGSTPGGSLPVFHGTTRSGAHSIREHGFQLDMKESGATAATIVRNPHASSNHFYTTNPNMARVMAEAAAEAAGPGAQAAVVKAKLPPEYRETLVPDPKLDMHGMYMSHYDTPPGYIQETRNVRGYGYEESKGEPADTFPNAAPTPEQEGEYLIDGYEESIGEPADAFPNAAPAPEQDGRNSIYGVDNLSLEDALREDDDFVF